MAVVEMPNCSNLEFVEALYAEYLRRPEAVDPEWQRYFAALANGEGNPPGTRIGPSRAPRSFFGAPAATAPSAPNPAPAPVAGPASGTPPATVAVPPAPAPATSPAPAAPAPAATATNPVIPPGSSASTFQDRVNQLIRNYRVRGHRVARIDPLGHIHADPPDLDPKFLGFSEEELTLPVTVQTYPYAPSLTVNSLIERLRKTYCGSIGVQYMHIDDIQVRRWLQHRLESTENRAALTREEQLRILTRLTDAVTFEEFILKKFVGAKSFGLTGSESLIPLLDLAIEEAGEQEVDEIVLGMAHRGRLNVLANILHKSPREIFREFADADPQLYTLKGDVKYHLGYSSDWVTAAGRKVHLSLCFNPSHLEFVNVVALGRTRAKMDRVGDREGQRCMSLLIHGDAAFAGEGVVQETLNLSRLPGYRTGGTLHVILNNQVGFTTDPSDARSCPYATDIARFLQVPIFHVNGEDCEAVAQCVRLAMEFRRTFQSDVIIDMFGYRRLGHNETDEPGFTQPLMYQAIAKRKSVREGYVEHLLKLGEITREESDQIAQERRDRLDQLLNEARSETYKKPVESVAGVWKREGFSGGKESTLHEARTSVEPARVSEVLNRAAAVPAGFSPHPKLLPVLERRREQAAGRVPLDWAAGELLAFGTLILEGRPVRLSGQDCERGTFSHRHAVLNDGTNGVKYCALRHLAPDQARFEVLNSPLSEVGVLGFDYGYSLDCPDGLIMWEAQFGDFVNVAQVIIDQFIVSAEEKWNRLSGLVMLLPHGMEGQGPEHSSARLERFLSMCAEDNIQVCQPTTPAQMFHLLRRQVLRKWRKPLVVMTPKSLLRHPKAVSSLEEFSGGGFQRVIPDPSTAGKKVERVLLCSGKIYYELLEKRAELKRDDVAIIRVEQLYPLPTNALEAVLDPYPSGTPVYWVQEEPQNMGAWYFLKVHYGDNLLGEHPFRGIHRPAAASPATGSPNSHKQEQQRVLRGAFGLL